MKRYVVLYEVDGFVHDHPVDTEEKAVKIAREMSEINGIEWAQAKKLSPLGNTYEWRETYRDGRCPFRENNLFLD